MLVMELLDGDPLSTLFERSAPMPAQAVISPLMPAPRVVVVVHEQGVIHRDLKPDDIFLAKVRDHAGPMVKVLDWFGRPVVTPG